MKARLLDRVSHFDLLEMLHGFLFNCETFTDSCVTATLPVTDSPAGINPTDAAPQSESSRKLYIDHVLENRNAHGIEDWTDESCIFTVSGANAKTKQIWYNDN